MRTVCVIGGSRYFGRHLVESLSATAEVTLLNRGSAPPPPGVRQLVADRNSASAMARALGDQTFDVVIDQVCYTPGQARIAREVFAGRTRRYVLTSTIEVYADLRHSGPVTEAAVDPLTLPVRPGLPEYAYGDGKRQAEAVLAQDPVFDLVSVRSAHVLGGQDFTGRLAHYKERIGQGRPVAVHADPKPACFINDREIAAVLEWAARADFTGAVNACSYGELDVHDLCEAIAAEVGRRPVYERGASPYSFDRYYAMDNGRAASLGFPFSNVHDWLRKAVACA
ncbi:reductase [Nonomuraea africana]|uniref:Nucleoside-diphosphate-sugar epimerase n=1 Tax=Nonomuraea africana TaxID=46171 RepID=A0ABR9KBA4_9ACTN|nr:reductase [Nonomuraea africana]MBE1559296.1 nucleoside-diphosphate-sugar epimerase [Nonomuraea africana]